MIQLGCSATECDTTVGSMFLERPMTKLPPGWSATIRHYRGHKSLVRILCPKHADEDEARTEVTNDWRRE